LDRLEFLLRDPEMRYNFGMEEVISCPFTGTILLAWLRKLYSNINVNSKLETSTVFAEGR
jgi:hypothetical protein